MIVPRLAWSLAVCAATVFGVGACGTPVQLTIDPCLVGEWSSGPAALDVPIGSGRAHVVGGERIRLSVNQDRSWTLDSAGSAPFVGTYDDHTVTVTVRGREIDRVHTAGGTVVIDEEDAAGVTFTTALDGVTMGSSAAEPRGSGTFGYSCAGSTMTLTGGTGAVSYTRTG